MFRGSGVPQPKNAASLLVKFTGSDAAQSTIILWWMCSYVSSTSAEEAQKRRRRSETAHAPRRLSNRGPVHFANLCRKGPEEVQAKSKSLRLGRGQAHKKSKRASPGRCLCVIVNLPYLWDVTLTWGGSFITGCLVHRVFKFLLPNP